MDILGPRKDYKEIKEEKKEDAKNINALPEFEVHTMKDDLAELGLGSGSSKSTKKISLPQIKKKIAAELIPPIPSKSEERLTEEEPYEEEKPEMIPPENLPIPRPKAALPSTEELIKRPSETLLPPLPQEEQTALAETPFSEPFPPTSDTLTLPKREEFTIPEPAYAPEKIGFRKKLQTTIILALALIIVVGGGIFFYLKNKKPIETPAPIQKIEPQLSQSFINVEAKKILSLSGEGNIFQALKEEAKTEQASKAFKRIGVLKSENEFFSLKEVFQNLEITIPPYILADMKENYNLFVFNQETGKRLGMIIEINDSQTLKGQLKNWEPTMLSDFKNFYPVQLPGPAASKTFLDDNYQGVAIRYVNLPYSTLTLNYALLNNLLIIGTSKELMYTAIDRILNK